MDRDPHLTTLGGRIINYVIMFACIALMVVLLWLILPYLVAWVELPIL